MGPSGAGKSTLMNVLAGFKTRNVSGQILVNGKPRNLALFRRSSCFIMQDAPLLSQLTVEEAMTCSSQLNLPRSCPDDQRKLIIEEILQTLGLSETRHTKTSDLSGGQRKRLSIAQEMINNPPIMFFDEPTSGLDSAASLQCIAALQTIAKQGRTVVCTIHQPSATVFDIFDQLYFLCGGKCMYRGPVKYLVPYLASIGFQCPRYHNPSDFLMDLASVEDDQNAASSILLTAVTAGRLEDELKRIQTSGTSSFTESMNAVVRLVVDCKSDLDLANADGASSSGNDRNDTSIFRKTVCVPSMKNEHGGHSFEVGLLHQIRILTKRTLICIWRDKTLTRLRLLAHVIVGILIGLLYFNVGNNGFQVINNAAFIFFSVLFIMFSSLMPTVMTFPLEMRVFVTEHLNYWYSVRAYYFAKTFADLPFQVVFSAIYGMIVYFMTDQPSDFSRFMIFLTMLVLTALVAQAQGLLIGASTDLEVSVFLGPATGIPILLFSGFFITLDTIPKYLQWLSYSSFTRYAFEGSMKAIYGSNRTAMNCSKRPSASASMPCLGDPQSVLNLLSISQYHFGIDFIVLILFFFVLRLLCFIVLRWRVRNST
ncbi:unnamed protein product [Hymenolepis diminuta]|uniref:ABC transporter domain-containing protein n=1 Tax=Hymenolepis diminuta TaxID=6216 RepID=A0A564YWI1_HYMDI|nr:unnamed protein product [Hymenolepis diminuta]